MGRTLRSNPKPISTSRFSIAGFSRSYMAQKNSLVINVGVGETRVCLIEDSRLGELHIERATEQSPVGNIYVGRVTRVLPGMQAAFIDVGLDRAAFLHVEDLRPPKDDSNGGDKKRKRASRSTPIRDLLKEGQELLVQVSKGPIGMKGARVTCHIALPGRYVVYTPTVEQVSVSKRIANDKIRKTLKAVVEEIRPAEGGVIVRTLGKNVTKNQLRGDIAYLEAVWQKALEKQKAHKASRKRKKGPVCVHEEPDLVGRMARDQFTEDVSEIIIDDATQFGRLREFLGTFLPERVEDVRLYEGPDPLFDAYGIEAEISRALGRKVPLPSGGHLVIDQAEALTAIDVNTGRFTGKGKNVEDTILHTNLEAVQEITSQLRFRNIGGLIVLDFIDMDKSANREKVYKALKRELRKDKARTTAVRISELGLVEMTRKRTHESLGRLLYEPCFYCDGTGTLKSKTTVCHEIFRQLEREKDNLPGYEIIVTAHPAVCDAMEREEKKALEAAEKALMRRIRREPRTDYHLEQFDLTAK